MEHKGKTSPLDLESFPKILHKNKCKILNTNYSFEFCCLFFLIEEQATMSMANMKIQLKKRKKTRKQKKLVAMVSVSSQIREETFLNI